MQHQKYTCPMHPQIMEEKSGNCTICGMTLVMIKPENNDALQHGSNPAMGHAWHDHNCRCFVQAEHFVKPITGSQVLF